MKIQDLSKELSNEERAVRGGTDINFASVGAPTLVQNGGGINLASPTTGVLLSTPSVSQTNFNPETTSVAVTKTADIVGSVNSLIGL